MGREKVEEEKEGKGTVNSHDTKIKAEEFFFSDYFPLNNATKKSQNGQKVAGFNIHEYLMETKDEAKQVFVEKKKKKKNVSLSPFHMQCPLP